MESDFIQIGVMSARAPDGSFIETVPIYTKRTPAAGMENALQKSRSRRNIRQGCGHEARSFTHNRLPMGTGTKKGGRRP